MKKDILFIVSLLGIVIAAALIVYGVNEIVSSTEVSFKEFFVLILGAVFGTGGVGYIIQSRKNSQSSTNESKDPSKQLELGKNKTETRHQDPTKAEIMKKKSPTYDLSLLTYEILIEFNACKHNIIDDTLKLMGLAGMLRTDSDLKDKIDSIIKYVKEAEEAGERCERLLKLAKVVWEKEDYGGTKRWNDFVRVIRGACSGYSDFGKIVRKQRTPSNSFPVQQFLVD